MNKTVGIGLLALGLAAALCCGTGVAQAGGMTDDTGAQDKKFLADASEGGLFEITAAKLAVKRSNNDEVKSLAQKLMDDHSKMESDLNPFDQKLAVAPATRLKPAHQQEISRLRALTGDKFNAEYVKAIDAAHHKDLGDFRTERDTTADADLKATVSSGYDHIKEHADALDALAGKMNLPVPADSAPTTP